MLCERYRASFYIFFLLDEKKPFGLPSSASSLCCPKEGHLGGATGLTSGPAPLKARLSAVDCSGPFCAAEQDTALPVQVSFPTAESSYSCQRAGDDDKAQMEGVI